MSRPFVAILMGLGAASQPHRGLIAASLSITELCHNGLRVGSL